MSELSDDTQNHDTSEELFSSFNVITISYDVTNGEPPVVDLGSATPWFAAKIFEQAAEALDMTMPYPRIICQGQVIFEPYHSCDNSDEEE